MKKSAIVYIIVFLVFVPVFANEKVIIGKVVKVSDGDTVRVRQNKKEFKIRLFGIDAPEKDQSFGKQSTKVLSDLILGKEVRVLWKEKDQYKRIVGVIYLGELNINQEMVTLGFAWVYRRYNDDSTMIQLEENAKEKKLGLWKQATPIPPWKFRRSQKADK